jgi:hypothetical protein
VKLISPTPQAFVRYSPDTLLQGRRAMQRLHLHRHHPDRAAFTWLDTLLVFLVIGAVIALNLVMMWRIATASG